MKRTTIMSGDEVVFLGFPKNTWERNKYSEALEEGEAYIVHSITPSHLSLVGVPGFFEKFLFELL